MCIAILILSLWGLQWKTPSLFCSNLSFFICQSTPSGLKLVFVTSHWRIMTHFVLPPFDNLLNFYAFFLGISCSILSSFLINVRLVIAPSSNVFTFYDPFISPLSFLNFAFFYCLCFFRLPWVFISLLIILCVTLCCRNSRRVRKIVKSDYYLRYVGPSVPPSIRMKQLGSHWTDFREIWYLEIFRKCGQKIQVSFIYDKKFKD